MAIKHKYKKLSNKLSEEVRLKYIQNLPSILKIDGDCDYKLYTSNGTLISIGYKRIVIGDYGAFIEFDKMQAIKENMKIKAGQEYRIYDENYNTKIKYWWLTAKDNSNIKIYYQQKTVTYADYLPQMFYVSPYEILYNENIG